jgi:hypothetical protein
MADGTEKRIDEVTVGEEVATYDNGDTYQRELSRCPPAKGVTKCMK